MGLLDEWLVALDQKRKNAGNTMRGLLSDPATELAQMGSAVGSGLTQQARGGLLGSQAMGSVMPEVRQAGYEQMLPGVVGMGPLQTVYHGSPHLFDKFDMSKIGTGEGAQSYGHGLYVAQNKGVAKDYRVKLGGDVGPSQYKVDGQPFDISNPVHRATWEKYLDNPPRSQQEIVADLERKLANPLYDKEQISGTLAAVKSGKFGKWEEYHPPPGNLYKVDLPDEHIAKMLDWDKPLSQQPKAVQTGLVGAMKKIGLPLDEKGVPLWVQKDPTGESIYAALDSSMANKAQWAFGKPRPSNDPGTAALLREHGVPGIKYLDAGSRAAGDGTRNYVVFDDKLLKILGRE